MRNFFREINAVPIRIQIASHREVAFVMPLAEPWFLNSFLQKFYDVELRPHYGKLVVYETIQSLWWLLSRFWRNLRWQKLLEAERKRFEILNFNVTSMNNILNWLKAIAWKIISEVWDFHLQKQSLVEPTENFQVLHLVSQIICQCPSTSLGLPTFPACWTLSIKTHIQVVNRNMSNQTPAVMDAHITADYVVVATIK